MFQILYFAVVSCEQSNSARGLARNVTNVQLQANFLYSLPTCIAFMCLLLARLMGQYCFARCRLSASSVVCNARGRLAAAGPGGRHCTAGQYCYVPLGRHLVSLLHTRPKSNTRRDRWQIDLC